MSSAVIWLITLFFLVLGTVGIVVPVLPGVGLVFVGILFYAMLTGFSNISVAFVVISGVIALGAWLIEYAGAAIGAKAGGGGKFTLVGTIAGSILGLMISGPIGLLAGAMLGAVAGAVYEGKTPEKANRAALLAIVGILGAKVVQAVLTLGLIVIFLLVAIF